MELEKVQGVLQEEKLSLESQIETFELILHGPGGAVHVHGKAVLEQAATPILMYAQNRLKEKEELIERRHAKSEVMAAHLILILILTLNLTVIGGDGSTRKNGGERE